MNLMAFGSFGSTLSTVPCARPAPEAVFVFPLSFPEIFAKKLFISSANSSIFSSKGSPAFTFSKAPRRKSSERNIRSKSSFFCSLLKQSMPLSRIKKNISSMWWAMLEIGVNSIIALEPFMVCMIRKISLTSSEEKSPIFSSAISISSNLSKSDSVSRR